MAGFVVVIALFLAIGLGASVGHLFTSIASLFCPQTLMKSVNFSLVASFALTVAVCTNNCFLKVLYSSSIMYFFNFICSWNKHEPCGQTEKDGEHPFSI